MVQVSGFGGIVLGDSRLDSGVVAVGAHRAMTGPVSCGSPSGGRGMSKGLLGWVVVDRVLGNSGSRDSVAFRYLLLSCRAGGVVGFGFDGL